MAAPLNRQQRPGMAIQPISQLIRSLGVLVVGPLKRWMRDRLPRVNGDLFDFHINLQ